MNYKLLNTFELIKKKKRMVGTILGKQAESESRMWLNSALASGQAP